MTRKVYWYQHGSVVIPFNHRFSKFVHNNKIYRYTEKHFFSLSDAKNLAKKVLENSPHTKIHIRAAKFRGMVIYRLHLINRYSERERLWISFEMLPF